MLARLDRALVEGVFLPVAGRIAPRCSPLRAAALSAEAATALALAVAGNEAINGAYAAVQQVGCGVLGG